MARFIGSMRNSCYMRNCAMRGIDNYINILFQINQAIDAVC